MSDMAQPYQLTNITEDLNDDRDAHLRYLIWGMAFFGVILFTLWLMSAQSVPAPFWITCFLAAGAAYLAQHVSRNLAGWVYLLGLLAMPIIQLNYFGQPNAATAILVVLPVIASIAFADRHQVAWVAGLSIISVFGVTWWKTDIGTALLFIALPGFVSCVLALVNYANEITITDMVFWAMDVQAKNSKRAEMFYQQNEQLAETLLQLQHANSKLEILNQRLEIAQQKAELASQTKSVFLSNMSHELRTPLNIIIGYSSSMLNMPQMFENTPLLDVHRPYMKLIEENGHYLLGLINDILDLSKIEAGKLELHPAPVDLPELLRGTISTSIGLLKDKPLQIRPDFPDTLPPVWADALRVRQIILNLMSNAIKFTHTGSVTLSAEVYDDMVRISVTDTGIGIPEKALNSIFDRFQQAEHDTDKHYGGTGLGLDISKQLALMHGGDLTVQSVVDQGSTFTFTLPIVRPEQLGSTDPAQPADDTIQVFTDAAVSPLETQAILLVEDEASTRELLHSALEAAGYVVIDAHEGEQALDLATGLLPDLILLDPGLPGMDGWDMLEALKANTETEAIPVIVFTAAPDAEKGYSLGAASVLQKPVMPADMLDNIRAVLTPISQTT
jgi:signal transduction histidine kinase/ActR/RegA family two-component response regulator